MQRFRKFSNRSLGKAKPYNDLYKNNHLTSVLESTNMHVFFLIDTSYCKTEDDDPKDAIIYFYPPQVPESQLCALCCQMTGAVQFFRTIFSPPKIIRLSRGKFAIKLVGRFLLSLGSSSDMPDKKLIDSVDILLDIFNFYHHSLEAFHGRFLGSNVDFLSKMQSVWKFLLESACSDERVSWIAGIIPRVANLLPSTYLTAFHLLQSCQRLPQVLAGCVVHNKSIVCTQLLPNISAYLCHFQDEHFKNTELEQQDNLIMTSIFLSSKDVLKMSSMNSFSKTFKKPWHITDFNTEASMSSESHEPELSEIDSSFEDGTKSSSPFNSQTFPKCASSDNVKPESGAPFLTLSASEPITLTVDDRSNISQSFDGAVPNDSKKLEPLAFKSNSLSVLQSVTEASLRRLKLYESTDDRPRYKRKKSRKSGLDNNRMFFSDGHESKSEMSVDAAAHSENSADSSFFEPKLLLDSQHSDISQKSELLTSTNKKKISVCSTTPVFLKLSQDFSDIQTPKRKKSSRMLNFTNEDENSIQTLGLCCVKVENTKCFLLMESEHSKESSSVFKMCFEALQQLNAVLSNLKPKDSLPSNPVSTVYCDHLWNSIAGDKLLKINNQLNDLQDNPTFKSITVMNMSGVAYTHSSMTHNIHVENNNVGSSVAGIPSPQDVMARISHLPKQKHDKMGYFLLR